jgi:lysophospholipase L1-like esterase
VIAKGGEWSWPTPELPKGEHLLEVLKETEGGVGEAQLVGIEVEGAALPPPERPKRRIEFVGDSHTVGFGALGARADCPFSAETESHSDAFAGRVAEALQAEAHFVAMSGRGVIRNYDDDRPPETVPVLWRRVLPDRPKSSWSPSAFVPDAVVVLLGSNDFGRGDPGEPFVEGYVAFLKELRAAYPKAHILSLARAWPDGFAPLVQRAVEAVKAAGEKNLSSAVLPKTAPGVPRGCAGHATPITHQQHAEVVQDALASALSWGWR